MLIDKDSYKLFLFYLLLEVKPLKLKIKVKNLRLENFYREGRVKIFSPNMSKISNGKPKV